MDLSTDYVIPTPSGEAARLSRKNYDALVSSRGGLSVYSYVTLAAAAQILAKIDSEPRSLCEITGGVPGEIRVPSIAERRAMAVLVGLGMVGQQGRTSQARYYQEAAF